MSMLRKKIGSFYLVRKIGSGRMSEVFLGVNPRTREKRAYKILGKPATLRSSSYARFLREVDVVRSLSHPGVIKISDSGVLDDLFFYSMEFRQKGSMARHLARCRLSVAQALRCFLQICDAMAYVHSQGIIHRDLKPSNILLNASGDPVISDFGIERSLDIERSTWMPSRDILGTIAYQAPEQRLDARKFSQRTDVYSLGAIFYEMIMGFPPLGNFPWPQAVHANFPNCLVSILEQCLAVDPEKRFEHAGHLMLDLEKCQVFEDNENRGMTFSSGTDSSYIAEDTTPPRKMDRIEAWFRILRTGTTRERLGVVREMVDKLEPAEAKAILKLYSGEGDRVRWGLIRVLGELRIHAAAPLILSDLNSPYHTECAIEALGKIGAEEAYGPLLEHVLEHPENALIALVPLAYTGKRRAVPYLCKYLGNETPALRQAAVSALAIIESEESLQALKDRLCVEHDEKVRIALFQAVHSLELVLHHEIDVSIMPAPVSASEKSV